MRRASYILALVLMSACLAGASGVNDVSLYLFSSVEKTSTLVLGDICGIDAPRDIESGVRAIPVEQGLFADGYIDRSELRSYLASRGMESVAIYGNAVKIQEKREKSAAIATASTVEHLVKSGEKVKMRVCKNGVMVETSATALQQGKRGATIRLQLQNSRKVNARVSSKGEVEVWL